ncbi:MAG: hypothetical protein M5R36_05725 [Deltaproteobacteria bacterium]|nr:hypothetical protein [Deltaproteobacteria bacterium]
MPESADDAAEGGTDDDWAEAAEEEIADDDLDLFAASAETPAVDEIPDDALALPEVDYGALAFDEAAAHVAAVRTLLEEAGDPARYENYVADLHAAHPRDLAAMEALRAVRIETGDIADADRLLSLMADAAEDAGLDDRLGGYLAQMHKAAPDDLAVHERYADHLRAHDPERGVREFTVLAGRAAEQGDTALAERSLKPFCPSRRTISARTNNC